MQLGHDGTSCLPHHIQDLKRMGLNLLGQEVQPSYLNLGGLATSKLDNVFQISTSVHHGIQKRLNEHSI